jgi:hypothetical protein
MSERCLRPSRRADACSVIVERHTAAEIDGYLVDVQTARVLLKVHAQLSPENRARFDEPPMPRLVTICWSGVI